MLSVSTSILLLLDLSAVFLFCKLIGSACRPDVGRTQDRYACRQKRSVAAGLFSMLCLLNTLRCFQTILLPYSNAARLDGLTTETYCTVASFRQEQYDSIGIAQDILLPDRIGQAEMPDSKGRIVRTDHGLVYVYGKTEDLTYGDEILAKIDYSRPSPARNPGCFDESRYYAQQGIYLKGRVISYQMIRRDDGFSATMLAYKVRSALIHSIYRMMPSEDAGMLVALILGDKSGMDARTRSILAEAGVSHIAAVSGSAVSFVFFPVRKMLRKLRVRRKYRNALLFASYIAFGYITLWTPSVTRALVMVLIVLIGNICNKKVNFLQTVAIALTIIVSANPVFALNAGFWFSVLATSGLIFFSDPLSMRLSRMTGLSGAFTSSAGVTLAAGIAILPLQIMMNDEISIASIFSNLLIMPAVQILVPAGLIAGILGPLIRDAGAVQILALPLRGMSEWLLMVSELVAKADFLTISTGNYPVLIASAAACLMVWMVSIKKTVKRTAFIMLCCFLFSGLSANIAAIALKSEVEVVFADVGQGDSTLIMFRNSVSVLVDSGDEKNGSSVVNGILDFYNIGYPDLYIATHTHADHCGAMAGLIAQRGGDTLVVPVHAFSSAGQDGTDQFTGVDDGGYKSENLAADLFQAATGKNMKIIEVSRNDVITIDENTRIVIHNPSSEFPYGPDRLNDDSIVMTVIYKGFSILIAGDASGESEKEMVDSGSNLRSNIYRISHHGSPTSTNHDIINAVDPEISVISVGFNFYGHPSGKVISRLMASGSRLYRTDRNGAVIIKYSDGRYAVKSMIP
ncbi:MAG: DNA internalization-related competence protein ComEC/Rec2 [Saccharofermentanales bacterium]